MNIANICEWIYENDTLLMKNAPFRTKGATHYDFTTAKGLQITPSDEKRGDWLPLNFQTSICKSKNNFH